jgi:hypothetical protein
VTTRRRLDALEAHVGAPDAPTWADARDAADRLRDGARARLAVVLAAHAAGTAAPPRTLAELAEPTTPRFASRATARRRGSTSART